MKINKDDWIIHGVIGTDDFLGGMCDAHSHGINKYGSRELQVVLYAPSYIKYINIIGRKIRDEGLKLYGGMELEGMMDDEAKIRIDDAVDHYGEPIWRIIFQDGEFKYPEESKEYPYFLQTFSPYKEEFEKRLTGMFSELF